MKIARGHFVTPHSVHERGQDVSRTTQGRRWRDCGGGAVKKLFLPGDRFIESRAPFRQATLLGGEVRAFVGNVIDKTHEGVQSSKPVALRLRQEKKGVVKIAMGSAGDTVAFFVRLRQVHLVRGRRVPT